MYRIRDLTVGLVLLAFSTEGYSLEDFPEKEFEMNIMTVTELVDGPLKMPIVAFQRETHVHKLDFKEKDGTFLSESSFETGSQTGVHHSKMHVFFLKIDPETFMQKVCIYHRATIVAPDGLPKDNFPDADVVLERKTNKDFDKCLTAKKIDSNGDEPYWYPTKTLDDGTPELRFDLLGTEKLESPSGLSSSSIWSQEPYPEER